MSNYRGFKPEDDIFVIPGKVDFRMSINGLTSYIQTILELPLDSKACFLFSNKSSDKMKIVHWDHNGFWLHYKRLEKGSFIWPVSEEPFISISRDQYDWLMNGLSIDQRDGFREVFMSKVV